jgi:hypothetical protein
MPADKPQRPFFEEIDFQPTPLGDLALRRRIVASLEDTEVYEITLGGGFLMSSLFTAVEIALADLALNGREGPLDVVVGGLGLGYTAQAALQYPAVRSLAVVEVLSPVIEWHRRGLVPLGPILTADPRCRFLHGDFFARAADPATGFGSDRIYNTSNYLLCRIRLRYLSHDLDEPHHDAADLGPGLARDGEWLPGR